MTAPLDQPLFSLGSTTVTRGMILTTAVVLVVSLALAWLVKRLTIKHFERHEAGDPVAVESFAKLMAALVFLVGFDIVLHIFGLRLASLFAAGGVFALGAGFAVKNTAENYISGFILRLDQTIRQGDVVEFRDRLLTIDRIGLRSTVGRTADGVEVLVPNSTLASATVNNLTRKDRLVRITTQVGVALDSDRPAVRKALEKAVADCDWKSEKQEAIVILEEFTFQSIIYSVSLWIEDVSRVKQAKSELNETIWRELDAAGITLD